jgi:hypothetical protein
MRSGSGRKENTVYMSEKVREQLKGREKCGERKRREVRKVMGHYMFVRCSILPCQIFCVLTYYEKRHHRF